MIFQLILSGLCAFILPCSDQSPDQSVKIVFPGGPFSIQSDKFPEHAPMLIVDVTDVDPSSTAMPAGILDAPTGKQYAYYKLEGKITLSIDDGALSPGVKKGTLFDTNVAKLKNAIKDYPELEKVRPGLLTHDGNRYARAYLELPLDDAGPPMDPMEGYQYDFHGGGPYVASERVSVQWQDAKEIEFLVKGQTIKLRDGGPKPDSSVVVVLSSLPRHIAEATEDLVHFPMYYFISSIDLKGLSPRERGAPKKHKEEGSAPEGGKPVACAVCQGCD